LYSSETKQLREDVIRRAGVIKALVSRDLWPMLDNAADEFDRGITSIDAVKPEIERCAALQ